MIRPDFDNCTGQEIADWWNSAEGKTEMAARLAAREAYRAEIERVAHSKPRALRPMRASGRVVQRYAVLVDGEKVGEVRRVRLKGRWAGSPNGIAYCWMSTPMRGNPMNSRLEAAEHVVDQWAQAQVGEYVMSDWTEADDGS